MVQRPGQRVVSSSIYIEYIAIDIILMFVCSYSDLIELTQEELAMILDNTHIRYMYTHCYTLYSYIRIRIYTIHRYECNA